MTDSKTYPEPYSIVLNEPPKDSHFIAIFADGSGADIYGRAEHGAILDSEGQAICDANDDAREALLDRGYISWLPLPDNFRTWWMEN